MNAELLVDRKIKTSRRTASELSEVAVFPTALGWIALAVRDESLVRLVFGYSDADAALEALAMAFETKLPSARENPWSGIWTMALTDRLRAYAEGQVDDFVDVPVWSQKWSPFQHQVLDCCRRIPYGQTQTYAELAAAAGSPGAARAVGRTMATNPIPLVIPCHRVLGSGGDLRGYSAIGGLDAKRRLLDLERAATYR